VIVNNSKMKAIALCVLLLPFVSSLVSGEQYNAEEESESGSGIPDIPSEMPIDGDPEMTGSADPNEFQMEEEKQFPDSNVADSSTGESSMGTNDTVVTDSPSKRSEKPKSLTSNTVVSVPASVIAKLSGSSNTSASLVSTPDQHSASARSVGSASGPIEAFKKDTNVERLNFLKTKPIGKMETLEIKTAGEASTKNNFTRSLGNEKEYAEKPSKVEFAAKKSNDGNKKKHTHNKKQTKKHRKGSKRSRIGFPKIILYQGPLSKALEAMLKSKASGDKKRSEIERMFRHSRMMGNHVSLGEDESYGNKKKSSVEKKKYKVKGFVDNVQIGNVAKKSVTTKEAKKDENKGDKRGFAKEDKTEKASVVASDEIMRKHVNSLMKKDKEVSTASGKDSVASFVTLKKKKKNSKFVATGPPKLRVKVKKEEDDEEEPEISGDDDKDDVSGEKSDKGSEEDDKDTGDDDDEDDEEDDASTPGIINHNPDEPKPAPIAEEPATVPENPAPSPDKSKAPEGLPSRVSPRPSSPSPSAPSISTSMDEPVDLPPPVQNLPPQNAPQPVPGPISPPAEEEPPMDEINPESPKLPEEMNSELPKQRPLSEPSYFQDDMMTQLDLNSQSIDTLISRVSHLETKEKELETAMGSISEGLERIEKKLDTQQQHKPLSSVMSNLPAGEFLPGGPLPSMVSPGNSQNRPSPNFLKNLKILNILKKIYKSFTNYVDEKLPGDDSQEPPRKRPKILKEIFIPLPPRGSSEAKSIEHGKLVDSPVLNRLPFPIRQIVTNLFRQQLKKEENQLPSVSSASLEPDEPAKEHDIDKLELELGRIPISRHGNLNSMRRVPKLLLFTKPPKFFNLMSRSCDAPCENGGRCLGNNVCRCLHGYTGSQCQRRIRPTIVEIIGPSPMQFFKPRRPSLHQISLPFAPTVSNEDEEEENDSNERTMGHVDQSKLVNILRKFSLPFREVAEEESAGGENSISLPFKRYRIPKHYDNRLRYNNQGGYYRY